MEQNKRKTSKQKKRRIKKGKVAITAFLFFAVVALIVLSFTVFFPITEIVIKEDTRYSASQILKQSGVAKGDNLFSVSQTAVSERLSEKLPYIGSVTLERSLPGTLTIRVTALKAQYAFCVKDGYLLVSQNKAVEIVKEAPHSLPIVNLNVKYTLGKAIDLGDKQESFDRLMKAISDAGLKNINEIRFDASSHITLIYDDRLTLEVGTIESVEKKMLKAVQIIASVDEDYSNNAKGTIKLQYEDSYFERASHSSTATSSTTSAVSTQDVASKPQQDGE